MTATRMIGAALGLALVAGPATGTQAPGLAQRFAAVSNSTVRFSFAARPGICGSGGGGINIVREGDEWEPDCDAGPVRVSVTVLDRKVAAVKHYVGGRWRSPAPDVSDWGMVSPRAASEFLFLLARAVDSKVGERALFPATLADSVEAVAPLLEIARDAKVREGTRRQAVFWLGRAAGDLATRGLDALVQDTTSRAVQERAVFALSQRPRDEGVPALIRVARTHRDPEIRKKALFWLGQSNDPRAIALFEELLIQR